MANIVPAPEARSHSSGVNSLSLYQCQQHLLQRFAIILLTTLALPAAALDPNALPAGGQITSGAAAVSQAGSQLQVTQATDRASLTWSSFNIGADAVVNFVQPSTSSVALNRVTASAGASEIQGHLSANGRIFLINPDGVLFGRTAQVNVGGLVASTLDLAEDDFLAGRATFTSNDLAGSVTNKGLLAAAEGGYIALLAPQIRNEGVITAHLGTVALGAGDQVTLDFSGDHLVSFTVDKAALTALIENKSLIQAAGGQVIIAARAASDLAATVVNNDGVIEATSVSAHHGVIVLDGGEHGIVSVAGTLDASGHNAGETGGTLNVLGNKVGVFAGAKLDVTGDAGGGTVLVGGNTHGQGPEPNAKFAYVDQDAWIAADALTSGHGGRAIVWADDITRYHGKISARGGTTAGDGGFVEVSGARLLDFHGRVDLGASHGRAGNLLLDPLNITLSTGADTNTLGFTSPGDITEAFADDAGLNSIFNVSAAGSFAGITTGSTITLQATNNITVSNAFNVATATGTANNSLVLRANNDINLNAAVTTTGTGSLTLQADADNSSTGTLALAAAVNAQIGGVNLSGANVTSTGAGTITTTGATNQNGGNVAITATNAITLGAAVITTGGTASAGVGRNAGNVTMSGVGITATTVTANGSAGNGANMAGGAGGAVSLSATGTVATGALNATGGNGSATNANGGNGGVITVSTNTGNLTTGALTARSGNAIGTGLGGTAGSLTVSNTAAAGTVTTGALTTTGGTNGQGGNVTVSALGAIATGNASIVTSGGTTLTGNAGRNAGNVTLTGAGVNLGTGTIAASGSAGLGASQAGGAGGVVNLISTGAVTTGALTASGGAATTTIANGGNAGTLSVINNSVSTGAISLGALTATAGAAFGTGAGGTAGSITVTNLAPGAALNTGAISTAGATNAHGGDVLLASQGGLTVTGTLTTTAGAAGTGVTASGRNAGNVSLTGVNRSVTAAITANGGAGLGTNQTGGNAGAISITGSGTLATAAINAQTGNATGNGNGGTPGDITLTGTTLTAAALTTTGGTNGDGGEISVTATGAINLTAAITATGGAASAGVGRNAGNVTMSGVGITATTVTANGSNGNGANMAGGAGGAVSLSATGTVATGALNATGGNGSATNANGGNGGVITVSTNTGNLTTGALTARSGNAIGTGLGGTAGSLTVSNTAAAGTVTTGALTTTGGTNGQGGNVSVTTHSGGLALAGIAAGAGTGGTLRGDVTLLSAGVLTQTGAIVANALTATTANNAGSAITLVTAGNDLNNVNLQIRDGTPIAIGTANVAAAIQYRDSNAVVITGINNGTGPGGDITVIAGGNITQTGALQATTLSAKTLSAGTASITLTNTANNATTVNLRARNVADTANAAGVISYADSDGFDIATLNTTGNATLSAAAAVSQSGAITVSGLALTGPNASYLLNDAGNAVATLAANTGSVNYRQAGSLTVGAVGVTGVSTTGATVLETTGAAANLTLNNPVNAGAPGDALILKAGSSNPAATATGGRIINSVGVGGIVTAAGRFLAYSGDPSTTTEGVTGFNKRYNADASFIPSGSISTFLYRIAPGLVVTADAGQGKIYDGSAGNALLTFSTSGLIDGDITATALAGDLTRVAAKNVGSYAITQGTLAAQLGYSLNYLGDNFTITPASITGVTGITADGKIYDGTATAILNVGAASFSGRVAGDALNVASANGLFSDRNAGVGKTVIISGITLSGADVGNYTLTSPTATTNADLTPAALTVTAQSDTRVYNATINSAVAPILTGTLFGGSVGSAGVQRYDTKHVGTGKTLSASDLVINDGNGGHNYRITFVDDTTGVITQASITSVTGITANNKIFDGTAIAVLNTGSAAFNGRFGDDLLSVASATGLFSDSGLGVAKPVIISGLTLSGPDAGNYTLARTTATTTADITAPPTPTTPTIAAAITSISAQAANPSSTIAALAGRVESLETQISSFISTIACGIDLLAAEKSTVRSADLQLVITFHANIDTADCRICGSIQCCRARTCTVGVSSQK